MLIKALCIEGFGTQITCRHFVVFWVLLKMRFRTILVLAADCHLFDTVSSDKVSQEDIAAIEGLLDCRSNKRAKSTNHSLFEVADGMASTVMRSGEAFNVVFTALNGTLLGSLRLVSQQVCGKIPKNTATFWIRARGFV